MNKTIKLYLISAFLLSVGYTTIAQQLTIDSATYYLEAYKSACYFDNGKLWGINFYTNQVIFDKNSRYTISNFKDTLGVLKHSGEFFYGYLPDTIKPEQLGLSTWIHKWLSSSINNYENVGIFIHEAFHYFQDSLRIKPKGFNNKQMNEYNARISIKMEAHFLAKAISNIDSTINYLKDAIKWRLWRQKQFPENIVDEKRFEILEGLAQYTGNYIACKYYGINIVEPALRIYHTIMENKDTSGTTSLERSFAYVSGQFYAILLDRFYQNWRKNVSANSDLANMLMNKLNLEIDTSKLDLLSDYKDNKKFKEVIEFETNRKLHFQEHKLSILKKFSQQKTLSIPTDSTFHFAFNPSTMITFEDGTFFPYFNASGNWGEIKVNTGGGIFYEKIVKVLINKDIIISENKVTNTNWVLILNKGWVLNKNDNGYYISKKIHR